MDVQDYIEKTYRTRLVQAMPGRTPCTCQVCITFTAPEYIHMNEINEQLRDLFNRIPRRHTADNVKEIYSILEAYEDLLMTMEADPRYGPQTVPLFESIEPIKATIKKSNSPKAGKKEKDTLFDEASGALKDSVEAAMKL